MATSNLEWLVAFWQTRSWEGFLNFCEIYFLKILEKVLRKISHEKTEDQNKEWEWKTFTWFLCSLKSLESQTFWPRFFQRTKETRFFRGVKYPSKKRPWMIGIIWGDLKSSQRPNILAFQAFHFFPLYLRVGSKATGWRRRNSSSGRKTPLLCDNFSQQWFFFEHQGSPSFKNEK